MTATNTKQLVRAILDTLREDTGDEASWAALIDLDEEGCFSEEIQRTLRRSVYVTDLGVSLSKPYELVWRLCQLVASEAYSQVTWVQTYSHYAEPGYDEPTSGVIAVGDWNSVRRWDDVEQRHELLDDTPELLGDLLEKLGCSLEWSDEWTFCDECGGLVRTQPDGFDWQPYYDYDGDGGIVCHDCRPAHPGPEATECGECGSALGVNCFGDTHCPECEPCPACSDNAFGEPADDDDLF